MNYSMKQLISPRLLAYALMTALPLWFGSCKKDGTDTVTPTNSTIQGTWKVSAYKIEPGVDLLQTGQKSNDLLAILRGLPNNLGADLVSCLTETKVTFNANGQVTSVPGAKCTASTDDFNPVSDKSTWKLDGNKLTITNSTGSEVYDVVINGSTLKMSQTGLDDYGEGSKTYTTTIELVKS